MTRRLTKRLSISAWAMIWLFALCSLAACDQDSVFFHYKDAPIEGWEKNDSITFDVPPIVRAGEYSTTIGLRVDTSFPFKSICLVVEQTIYPAHKKTNDTIYCQITDKDGNMTGQGQNIFQYSFPTRLASHLSPGDSIHYTVRHNMKRSIMPGISDVGIRLKRKK